MSELLTLGLQSTLFDALRSLDGTKDPLCVVDESGRLVGAVGDREARDAVARANSQGEQIIRIMNLRPLTLVEGEDETEVMAMLKEHFEPWAIVVDRNGKPSRIIHRDDVVDDPRILRQAILMVGGEGTRLRPLTENLPKPMLPVAGRPILEHILEHLKNHGIEQVTMALGYRAQQIKEHFGAGKGLGLNIEYVLEEKPLGTAGAIGLISDIDDSPLLVMNGDILTDLDLSAMALSHVRRESVITVGVRPYQHQVPYGVTKLMGTRIISLEEKPMLTCWSNAGIYVLDPQVRSVIPKNTYHDMTLLIENRISDGDKVSAFAIREYWCDIGLPEDYDRAMSVWQDR